MKPNRQLIQPTYAKENGLWVLDIDAIELPLNFKAVERNVVHIPPGTYGGNHKHPRSEVFIAIGEGMKLVWLTEKSKKEEASMHHDDGLLLFHIPANLAHAVINESTHQFGMLIEFADAKQHDVTPVDVLS